MLDMVRKDILPAVSGYIHRLTRAALAKKELGDIDMEYELESARQLSQLAGEAHRCVHRLDDALANATGDSLTLARSYHDGVLSAMNALRAAVDEMEVYTDASCWPYPSYGAMLFSVR